MPRLTPEREEEIRKLRQGITPPPWRPCPDKAYVFSSNGAMIASQSCGRDGFIVEEGTVELRGLGAGLPMDQNHDFIVAAPTIVDELYAEVLALREALARAMRFELAAPVVVDVKALEESIAKWRRDPLNVIVAATPSDEELRELAALKEARPKCDHCDNPATCFGSYEGSPENYGYACDTCCGHGCEDGHCEQLADNPKHPGELAREYAIEAAKLEERDPTDEEAQALIRIDSNNYSESDMGVLHSYVRRLELTKKDLQP